MHNQKTIFDKIASKLELYFDEWHNTNCIYDTEYDNPNEAMNKIVNMVFNFELIDNMLISNFTLRDWTELLKSAMLIHLERYYQKIENE